MKLRLEEEEPPGHRSPRIIVKKNPAYDNLTFPVSAAAAVIAGDFHATDLQWNDWRWQRANSLTKLEQLEKAVCLSDEERRAIESHSGRLPFSITPYYLSLVSKLDPEQPVRRTVIPVTQEYVRDTCESDDPLGEEHDSPVEGIVHRYPDRVLFLVSNCCFTHCRYCTRSRIIYPSHGITQQRLEEGIEYVRHNSAVRDVLISGGDPLVLSDSRLEWLLRKLRAIPHVEVIRIGTKAPVVLPQRITHSLVNMIRKFHPVWINIHFTHPAELTPEVAEACRRLVDAGIPLGSQTVLLSGINDDVETMKRRMHGLVRLRVRPYYLYQCDPITGSSHFRTPVSKGIEIIEGLRGHTSGFAVPTYVIDSPGGGGKVPVTRGSAAFRDSQGIWLENYEKKFYFYPDPADARSCTPCE